MPINPHRKGGPDIPIADGGTAASVAATALSNLGGLDATAHASIDHSVVPATFFNVGAATSAVANGDFAAGDGTREIYWDASVSTLELAHSGTIRSLMRLRTGAGPVASSTIDLLTDNGGTLRSGTLDAWSSAYTTVAIYDLPSSVSLTSSLNMTNGLGLNAFGSAPIKFYTDTGGSGGLRWQINSAGHLLGGADNTFDIGASGATRPRTGYLGTSLNVGNGVTPSTANGDIVAGDGTRGMFFDASAGILRTSTDDSIATPANSCMFVAHESERMITLRSTLAPRFRCQRQRGTLAAPSTILFDEIVGGLEIDSYIGSTSGFVNTAFIRMLATSTPPVDGSSAPTFIQFGTTNTGSLAVTERWEIRETGHLLASADNTYDIGASGATRPRTAYVGTSLNVGSGITPSTANGDIVAGDGTRALRWDASAVDFEVGYPDTATGGPGLHFYDNSGQAICLLNNRQVTPTVGLKGYYAVQGNSSTGAYHSFTIVGADVQDITEGSVDVNMVLFTKRLNTMQALLTLGNTTTPGGNARAEFANNAGTRTVTIDMDALSLTSVGALTVASATTSAITIDSGSTGAVNLGTGASAKAVSIGNATGATSVSVDSGSGGITLTTAGGGTVHLLSDGIMSLDSGSGIIETDVTAFTADGALTITATSAVLSLDGTGIETSATTLTADAGLEIATTTTGVLTLDSGTTGTINIGVDATNAKTLNLDSGTTGGLNIGTSAFAKTITVGNVTGATGLVYNAGTGGHAFTGDMGFYGSTPTGQSAAYTRTATVVEDRTLLASASATATNNNNVLAALIADLQLVGLLG